MKGWLEAEGFAEIEAGGTTAFRLFDSAGAWVERFGESALVSASTRGEVDELAAQLGGFADRMKWECRRTFGRVLVRTPGAEDKPFLVSGDPGDGTTEVVIECGLRYEVDFSASYSVGLFCDQRANRVFLRERGAGDVLNTFSYTCAFSVAAAAGGARTTSVDVSKASLARGRRNFELNGLDPAGHRFVAEDVGVYLARLARRGEVFDAVILDPPTFGRGGGRKTFQIARDFPGLIQMAAGLTRPGGAILISTNYSGWGLRDLQEMAAGVLLRGKIFQRVPAQADFAAGGGSLTVWALPGGS